MRRSVEMDGQSDLARLRPTQLVEVVCDDDPPPFVPVGAEWAVLRLCVHGIHDAPLGLPMAGFMKSFGKLLTPIHKLPILCAVSKSSWK